MTRILEEEEGEHFPVDPGLHELLMVSGIPAIIAAVVQEVLS